MIAGQQQQTLLSPGGRYLRLGATFVLPPAPKAAALRCSRRCRLAAAGHEASPDGSFPSSSPAARGPQGVGAEPGSAFAFVDASLPQRTGGQSLGRHPPSAPSQPHFGGGVGWGGPGSTTAKRTNNQPSAGAGSNKAPRSAASTTTTTTTTTTSPSAADATGEGAPHGGGAAPTAAAPHQIAAQAPISGAASSNGAHSSTTNGSGNGAPQQPSPEESVAAALARAQDALQRVETSLESIEDLPSARPPSQLGRVLSLARTAVAVCALSAALVASQAFGLGVQLLSALLCSVAVAWWGWAKQSLSASGALAALAVGTATIGCSLRFGATLLAFFFSCSKLTSFKDELKEGLDDAHKANGQRDWRQVRAQAGHQAGSPWARRARAGEPSAARQPPARPHRAQVACNGAVPTLLAVAYGVLVGCVDVPFGPSPAMEAWRAKAATLLGGAFLGYYACCCGDTWASELGPLSSDTPRLITTLRPVRRGTNGGVTLLGLSASILGGVFVGAVFYAAAVVSPTLWVLEGAQQAAVGQWRLVPLGLMAGLLGSVLDSVLGATVQVRRSASPCRASAASGRRGAARVGAAVARPCH